MLAVRHAQRLALKGHVLTSGSHYYPHYHSATLLRARMATLFPGSTDRNLSWLLSSAGSRVIRLHWSHWALSGPTQTVFPSMLYVIVAVYILQQLPIKPVINWCLWVSYTILCTGKKAVPSILKVNMTLSKNRQWCILFLHETSIGSCYFHIWEMAAISKLTCLRLCCFLPI